MQDRANQKKPKSGVFIGSAAIEKRRPPSGAACRAMAKTYAATPSSTTLRRASKL